MIFLVGERKVTVGEIACWSSVSHIEQALTLGNFVKSTQATSILPSSTAASKDACGSNFLMLMKYGRYLGRTKLRVTISFAPSSSSFISFSVA
jgi:hypothetical protein